MVSSMQLVKNGEIIRQRFRELIDSKEAPVSGNHATEKACMLQAYT